jgi:hypothetical protein
MVSFRSIKTGEGNMVKKVLVTVFLVLVGSIIVISDAYPEMTFDYGASIRLRQEIWDNVVTLDTINLPTGGADRNFFRFRTSLWGKVDFDKDLGAYLKLTNEAKYYIGPYKPNTPSNYERLDEDELVVDNLYVNAKNVFGLPVDLKVGRQDFLGPDMFGEGFLFVDGTPGDGSRTFYFNAARAKWRITENHSVDFVYLSNPKTDTFLPSMYPAHHGSLYQDHKKLLNGSDEQGFVIYSRNKINNLTLEPYYIYKTEEPVGPLFANPKLKLNTVGARALYTIDAWKLGGEFAHQFGEYDGGRDRTGNGGYVFANYTFKDTPLKPTFELRYVYLSGDDPNTSKHEGWDPLFSRAPYWNELIIYTFINETIKDGGPIPGYWTNLHLFMAKATMNFTPSTNLCLTYQYLRADERTSGLNAAMFSNNGKERGHLPTAVLSHKFSKNIDGFLQFEYFIPGNFYNDNAKNAIFFRWQLQFKV